MTRGEHMRAARKAAGLTARALAKLSGITHVTILNIENGHCDGRISTVEVLADALGLSLDEYTGHEVVNNG